MVTSARDVLAMLRRHYLPENRPAGVLWMPEIASPCGSRRADLLIAPTAMSHLSGGALVGHEIKVTRSDTLAELADPTKPDPWMRHCSRWWLVVADPALVDGLDIPESWGVMAPPSGRRTRSMTVLRQAPQLTPVGDARPALTRIAQFVVARVEAETARLERAVSHAEDARDRTRAELDRLRIEREHGEWASSPHVRKKAQLVREVIDLVEAGKYAPGVPYWEGDVEARDVADAILDAVRTRTLAARARRRVEGLIDEIRELTTGPLESLASDLASLDLDAIAPPEQRASRRKRR